MTAKIKEETQSTLLFHQAREREGEAPQKRTGHSWGRTIRGHAEALALVTTP